MALHAAVHVRYGEPLSTTFEEYGQESDTRDDTPPQNTRTTYPLDPGESWFDSTNEQLSLYDHCNSILDRIDDLCASCKYDGSTVAGFNEVSEHLNHWKSSIHWIWSLNGPLKWTSEQIISWLLGEIEGHEVPLSDTIRMYMTDMVDALNELHELHAASIKQEDFAVLCSALLKDLDTASQCLGQQLIPIRAFAENFRIPEEYDDITQFMYLNEPRVPSLYTDSGSSVRDSVSTGKLRSSTSYSEYSADNSRRFSGGSDQMHIESWGPALGKDNRTSLESLDSDAFPSSSRHHYLSPSDDSLARLPPSFLSDAASFSEQSASLPSRKRHTSRAPAPDKDYYKTCVSRKQRARRVETAPKYFCTSCREPFVEKADWKRHEESFQERPEEFQCDNCSAKYFLDKDFVMHHVSAHGCVPCNTSTKVSVKKHVQEAKLSRATRSGWGCGFCYHFSSNWTERCNHIAGHFEHEGKTMADWNHSSVIYSLLQRPEISKSWNAVLKTQMRNVIGFGWDPATTGRVEGYPDSTQSSQLQDELEYYKPRQNAILIAQKALDLAVTKVKHESPPPVPPKDYTKAFLGDVGDGMKETKAWTEFVRSITNDDNLPSGSTSLESGALDDDMSF